MLKKERGDELKKRPPGGGNQARRKKRRDRRHHSKAGLNHRIEGDGGRARLKQFLHFPAPGIHINFGDLQ